LPYVITVTQLPVIL